MPRFRKKPVVIDAFHFTGNHYTFDLLDELGCPPLIGDASRPNTLKTADGRTDTGWYINPADGMLMIRTLEGDMRASIGHYIIKGVKGEFYPCDPDIFAATYETTHGSEDDQASPNLAALLRDATQHVSTATAQTSALTGAILGISEQIEGLRGQTLPKHIRTVLNELRHEAHYLRDDGPGSYKDGYKAALDDVERYLKESLAP
ncbi:hypothetical protein [Actinobaculum sp. 352]|uniref:hypothetical protein n=1 Tax=Actinobaculum sp. 352 TaxID=2490946 RepID=UPI0019D1D469|nr:hypothetical protein [Actinobaculum sp. 352]